MIKISLIITLMILSTALEIFRIYFGLPEITGLTRLSNVMVMAVLVVDFSLILGAFIVQQYERRIR